MQISNYSSELNDETLSIVEIRSSALFNRALTKSRCRFGTLIVIVSYSLSLTWTSYKFGLLS